MPPSLSLLNCLLHCSASGCPHANRNKSRPAEAGGLGGGLSLKYGGLIKATLPPPGPFQPAVGKMQLTGYNRITGEMIATNILSLCFSVMDWPSRPVNKTSMNFLENKVFQ